MESGLERIPEAAELEPAAPAAEELGFDVRESAVILTLPRCATAVQDAAAADKRRDILFLWLFIPLVLLLLALI